MAYVVQQSQRHGYHLSFEILASSNQSSPACLCPNPWVRNNIFPVSSPEFAAVYKQKIRDTVVDAILALFPTGPWVLNVFRMGFEAEELQNPILIQLVVESSETGSSNITEATASEIVATIMAAVVGSGWKGEE